MLQSRRARAIASLVATVLVAIVCNSLLMSNGASTESPSAYPDASGDYADW